MQEATNLGLPNSQTVAEVIAQPVQSSNEASSQQKVCKKLCAPGQGLRTDMSRMHKNEFKELKNTQ